MFGLKIFVRVQTFRRVPPVLPRSSCHPGVWCVHLVDQLVAGVLQVVVQLDTLVGTHLVCKMLEADQVYVKAISKYAGWVSDSVRICNVGVPIMVVF